MAAGLPQLLGQTGRAKSYAKRLFRVAQRATVTALAELDASFFRVRFDRLTPSEKAYMRAMAELGPGPHRSGDIADQLKKKVTTVAPIRNALIAKGMIYSPAHGDTAFTVPLFDAFMKRTIAL
jgi:DNA-binding MarR family transcriptional regulator